MYSSPSVILNVSPVGAFIAGLSPSASLVFISAKTQFLVQVKDTLRLINGICNVLQKLLRYFKGTENSSSFVFPSSAVFPVILVLYLKDSESFIGSIEISL